MLPKHLVTGASSMSYDDIGDAPEPYQRNDYAAIVREMYAQEDDKLQAYKDERLEADSHFVKAPLIAPTKQRMGGATLLQGGNA